jgi:hypothetical protein
MALENLQIVILIDILSLTSWKGDGGTSHMVFLIDFHYLFIWKGDGNGAENPPHCLSY